MKEFFNLVLAVVGAYVLGYVGVFVVVGMLGEVARNWDFFSIFFIICAILFVSAYFIGIAKRYEKASESEKIDIKIYLCGLSLLVLSIAAFIVWLFYDLGYIALGLVALMFFLAIITPTPLDKRKRTISKEEFQRKKAIREARKRQREEAKKQASLQNQSE